MGLAPPGLKLKLDGSLRPQAVGYMDTAAECQAAGSSGRFPGKPGGRAAGACRPLDVDVGKHVSNSCLWLSGKAPLKCQNFRILAPLSTSTK